ncbi:hypothetical protein F4703DRAFT_1299576 [Phycomyces blakesleeanus]
MTTQVVTKSETKKTQDVTVVVKNYRKELTIIVERARIEGVKHCTTKKERKEYLAQLATIEHVASTQTFEVEKVAIQAIEEDTDVKSKIETIVKTTTDKINERFDELKSSITFSSVVHAEEVVEKTKKAASAVEAKRVAAAGWFSKLTETINSRIQEGGDNVKEDIAKITEKAEEEISTVLKEEDEEDDETIKGSVGTALVSIKDSIAAQLTQVKNVITETTDTSALQEKFTKVSEKTKQEIDTTFTTITDKVQNDVKRTEKEKFTVQAVETSVADTTKEATETVQGWYSNLTTKLSTLVGNDSEEAKAEAQVIIAEAETELKEKIDVLKKTSKTESKTETNEHLDSYFSKITDTVKNQLTAVKTAVSENAFQDKTTFEESIKKTETKLQEDITTESEVVKTEAKTSIGQTLSRAVLGSAAAVAGAVGLSKLTKENKVTQTNQATTYQVTETVIETTRTEVTRWLATFTTEVVVKSETKKTEDVTYVVEKSRKELTVILERARNEGVKHCTTKKEREDYLSQLTIIEQTAFVQTTRIEQVTILAIKENTDVRSQIETIVTESTQKINEGFEELKSRVVHHSEVHAQAIVEKTKKAATAVEAKRVAATGWFSRLTETINSRIQEGGENVKEDIAKITEKAEEEISTVLKEEDEEDDETIKGSVGTALVSIKDSIAAQLTEVKNVITETTDTSALQEKFTKVSEKTKHEIDNTFNTVTDKVKTDVKHTETEKVTVKANDLITVDTVEVDSTTKKATETVESWYSNLKTKLSSLVEVNTPEAKAEAAVIIEEAEVDLKKKLDDIKETSKTTTKTESTEHIDSYFGQLTNSVKKQLTSVKTAVSENAFEDKVTFENSWNKGETKLQEEIASHTEVVKTEAKKKTISETLGNVVLGSAAVAAGLIGVIGITKKHDSNKIVKTQEEAVIIETTETVIENTRTEINRWFSTLTTQVITTSEAKKTEES